MKGDREKIQDKMSIKKNKITRKRNLTYLYKTKKQKVNSIKNVNTYNYFSATEYYPDKYVENLFAVRGNWNRISINELKSNKKPIHFFHINGKYILNKSLYGYYAELKNLVDSNKNAITYKNNLITNLQKYEHGKKYIMESHNINAHTYMKNPIFFKKIKTLFKPKSIYIFKPVSGYAGANIEIITSYPQFLKSMNTIIKKWSSGWAKGSNFYKEWVLQEYLANPLLYTNPEDNQKYKFHIRQHFIFRPGNKKSFFFKRGLFITGLKPYKQGEWSNKMIHDTHFHGRDGLAFPEELNLSDSQIEYIYKQIYELYSIIDIVLKKNTNCFEESKYCFEVFGADLMITKDYNVKILEMNSSPGLAYEDREEILDEKRSVIENYMALIVDEYFPPKNKVVNKYINDVVFIN